MTPDKDILEEALAATSRRSFLRRASLTSLAAAAAPAAFATMMGAPRARGAITPSPTGDVEILNFALNLEYLEAQYYSYAVNGVNLSSQGVNLAGGDGGPGGTVILKPNFAPVPFSSTVVQQFAQEIAQDEMDHVLFVRSTLAGLGNLEVAQPQLDLYNSFNALAAAAGLGSFDPFASDENFLLGGAIFEDIGATAYKGAADQIYNPAILSAAAGILAVEGYHAATLRATLFLLSTLSGNSAPIAQSSAIAGVIDMLGTPANPGKPKAQGISLGGMANIVPTDANALAFGRSTEQILRIAYGNTNATPGGFFPLGFNGTIK